MCLLCLSCGSLYYRPHCRQWMMEIGNKNNGIELSSFCCCYICIEQEKTNYDHHIKCIKWMVPLVMITSLHLSNYVTSITKSPSSAHCAPFVACDFNHNSLYHLEVIKYTFIFNIIFLSVLQQRDGVTGK